MYSTKHPLMTTDARYTPAAAVDAEDADAPNAALVPPPSFRARCRSYADHASCYVTLVAWLLLPFFFLGLYLYLLNLSLSSLSSSVSLSLCLHLHLRLCLHLHLRLW